MRHSVGKKQHLARVQSHNAGSSLANWTTVSRVQVVHLYPRTLEKHCLSQLEAHRRFLVDPAVCCVDLQDGEAASVLVVQPSPSSDHGQSQRHTGSDLWGASPLLSGGPD